MKTKSLLTVLLITAVSLQVGFAAKKVKPVKYDLEINDQTVLDEAVLKLLPKGASLIHQVTQGIYGPADGTKGSNINVIYRVGNKTPELMVLVPAETGKYKKIKPEKLNFAKSDTTGVHAVFFAQADKDEERELFVLCEVVVKGTDTGQYMTAVFDWKKKGFKRINKIESKIKGIYPSINVKRALPEIIGSK